MRRWRCRRIGLIVVLAGAGVLVIMLLPSGFWMFAIGIILILAGLAIMCR
jgi:predicted branched-subunit amino acid permease